MRKIILPVLLTLAMTTVQASDLHQREGTAPQSLAERAEWKEARIEEAEACGKCGGSHKDEGSTAYNHKRVHTSHVGIYYFPVAVSTSGDEVTLLDGSVWQIRTWDREQTRTWLATDEIIILPNNSFFSFYDYKLFNQMTGAEVEANMLISPMLGTTYTRQILGFNDANNYIYLSDNSVWTISPNDYHLYKKWAVGDIVMIGSNQGWDANIRPNILINATYRTYIRANCIQ